MLSFFPRGVLDEFWDLIESVSEGFPTYSSTPKERNAPTRENLFLKDGLPLRREAKNLLPV